MFLLSAVYVKRTLTTCLNRRFAFVQKCLYSQDLENIYSDDDKQKILDIMNSDEETLSRYNMTKTRLKKISQWKNTNGNIKTISDVDLIEGFTEKYVKKLFRNIIDESPVKKEKTSKIRGQILQPHIDETTRRNCKSVLSLYVTVNSVNWTLINCTNYELVDWNYYKIDYSDGKRLQLTDLLSIAYKTVQQMPMADIYVMKAEATTLRAAGSDPNNPKVIAINLQKSQMISMIVALINCRHNSFTESVSSTEISNFKQSVYFLRPTLPYRLYGTLVGSEKVSTDQTVEMLLQNSGETPSRLHVFVPERLKRMFRAQKDLEKDMLGNCLLLALTFMDICIYKNQESIKKLAKRAD